MFFDRVLRDVSSDAAQILLLPIAAAFFLSWLGFYACKWTVGWAPRGFSPLGAAALIGATTWSVRFFFIGDVWSPQALLNRVVLTLVLTFPVSIVVAPMLFAYMTMAFRGEVVLNRGMVIGTSLGCLILNILFIEAFLRGS